MIRKTIRKIVRKFIFLMPEPVRDLIPVRIRQKFDIPLGRWEYQVAFWNNWFRDKGGYYSQVYESKVNPEKRRDIFPNFMVDLGLVEKLIVSFPGEPITALDVGSGPISELLWGHDAGLFELTCVDALGLEYDKLFKKYGLEKPLHIHAGLGEDMKFTDKFHIVFCKNALDHCLDPKKVFENITKATKDGGYIIIWSYINEGTAMNWSGGHQHDIDLENQQLTLTNKIGYKVVLTSPSSLIYIWSHFKGEDQPPHQGQFQVIYQKIPS